MSKSMKSFPTWVRSDNKHCCICFKQTKVESMYFINNEGGNAFAFCLCKDCASDVKDSVSRLFEEEKDE